MMAEFRFDESKSFAENCQEFLEAVKADDPEMATILHDNWDKLISVAQEGNRDSKVRGEFNAKVVEALDTLAPKSPEPKGGA